MPSQYPAAATILGSLCGARLDLLTQEQAACLGACLDPVGRDGYLPFTSSNHAAGTAPPAPAATVLVSRLLAPHHRRPGVGEPASLVQEGKGGDPSGQFGGG
eukprot:scaffold6270_cov215-Prasinococcus_capsulatus_cf.AAC.3